MAATSSAPGKILLLGGYSVLEKPNVAYVLAVNAFVRASAQKRNDNKIILSSLQLKIKTETDVESVFDLKPDAEGKNKFLLAAAKCALQYLKFRDIVFGGFELETKSDGAFSVEEGKSGLGSSAAVSVAVVKAIFDMFGFSATENINEVHKIAQFAHAMAQNKAGSGFDVAAACFGSISYSRYSPELLDFSNSEKLFGRELDCQIRKIFPPKDFTVVYASFPNESMSTVNAVSKIMEWKKANPSGYAKLMHELDLENRKAIRVLEVNGFEEFKVHFENGRELTKKLGIFAGVEIENDANSALIEEAKKHGAFVAKLPGAGGGDAVTALCLSKKDALSVKSFFEKKGLKVIDINLIYE